MNDVFRNILADTRPCSRARGGGVGPSKHSELLESWPWGGLWSSLSLMKLRAIGVWGGESGGGAGFIELGRVTDVV